MMQVAFVLLCFAQIVHFSKHWLLVTQGLMEDAQDQRVRVAVDWKAHGRSR